MKTYIVKYSGNDARYKNYRVIAYANNSCEAVRSVCQSILDEDYSPQNDGTVKNCKGNIIAQPNDDRLWHDGGWFYAEEYIRKSAPQELADKLNEKFNEDIFWVDDYDVVTNWGSDYCYEGNDVSLTITDDGKVDGRVSGLTCVFDNIEDAVKNINALFVKEKQDD